MIVCRTCSRRHADGTPFCSCGAYLEFDGERVPDGPQTDMAAVARPAAADRTTRWSEGADGPGPDPDDGDDVDARLPGASDPVDAFRHVYDDTRRAGDIVCPGCSRGNPRGRRFCEHCGESLDAAATLQIEAVTERRRSWWARLWDRVRRHPVQLDTRQLATGARRASTRGLSGTTRLFRVGGVAVIAALAMSLFGPLSPMVYTPLKRAIGGERYARVEADSAEAIGPGAAEQFPLQAAPLVLDGHENTAWATRFDGTSATDAEIADGKCVGGDVTETTLRITFKEPTDFDRVHLLGGRTALDDTQQLFLLPHVIEVDVDGVCGARIILPDTGELAAFDVKGRDALQVDLRIVELYPGAESVKVELSEVVFQRRR